MRQFKKGRPIFHRCHDPSPNRLPLSASPTCPPRRRRPSGSPGGLHRAPPSGPLRWPPRMWYSPKDSFRCTTEGASPPHFSYRYINNAPFFPPQIALVISLAARGFPPRVYFRTIIYNFGGPILLICWQQSPEPRSAPYQGPVF